MSPELRARLVIWLDSNDPVERAHAARRLAQGEAVARANAEIATGNPQISHPTFALPEAERLSIPLAESLELHRLIHRCQYRSTPKCGCSGARCGLRFTAVSHRDCLACMRTYGVA